MIGMALGRIPWTAIQEYCDRMGLDELQREAMVFHITYLDAIYLKHIQKSKKG